MPPKRPVYTTLYPRRYDSSLVAIFFERSESLLRSQPSSVLLISRIFIFMSVFHFYLVLKYIVKVLETRIFCFQPSGVTLFLNIPGFLPYYSIPFAVKLCVPKNSSVSGFGEIQTFRRNISPIFSGETNLARDKQICFCICRFLARYNLDT